MSLAERIGYAVEPNSFDRTAAMQASLARSMCQLGEREAASEIPVSVERAAGIVSRGGTANVILRGGTVTLERKTHDPGLDQGGDAWCFPIEPPLAALEEAIGGARHVALFGHYDVHGMMMTAITHANIETLGASVTPFFGYKSTGDVHRLWKRLIPKLTREGDFDCIVLVDVPVDARDPERTRATVRSVTETGARVVIVDHHGDTLKGARGLVAAGACVHLTDAWGCFLGSPDARRKNAATLGALSDRQVDAIPSGWESPESEPYRAVESLSAYLDRIRTDMDVQDREDPLALVYLPLKEGQVSLPPESGTPPPSAEADRVGRAVVFKEPPKVPGRQWYGVLERAMEKNGTPAGAGITPASIVAAPYAIAWRRTEKLGNILFLTHWLEPFAPPIRLFANVEEGWKVFGHDSAFWLDVPLERAEGVVSETVTAINEFLD
jgi:hypothetical protein